MPLSERDYMREKHPPNCTCADCTNKRLGDKPDQIHINYSPPPKTPRNQQDASQNPPKKPSSFHASKYLIALLLVISLSICGFGLSLYVDNKIPLVILFGFSFIYSIEKWFRVSTTRNKIIGKLYRFILNLAILSLLGLLVWSGIQLFSQQFFQSQIIGSVIFTAELVFFAWTWRVVAKNSWRWPSMKLTIFSLIILFLIFAYAGVEPIKSYKDTAFSDIGSFFENIHKSTESISQTPSSSTYSSTSTSKLTITSGSKTSTPSTAETSYTTTQQIYTEETTLKDPTWAQLVSFLQQDNTDKQPYIYPSFVCYDFACMLQDHAKKAGWRCALVEVQLSGYPDWYHLGIPSNTGHECNAFKTTDKGLVYIDCTGVQVGYLHSIRMVKTVDVKVGNHYIPISLFPEPNWNSTWDDMGTITGINSITW